MQKNHHLHDREPCPYLPPANQVTRPSDIREIRKNGGIDAYLAALTCAQSLWLQALPAQAILQLNHAMSHDLAKLPNQDIPWPMPYQALVWILTRRHEEGFIGNPVRHFQHLATRMSGPNQDLRVWRAWACFHLAESVLPNNEFPRDAQQITREDLKIPDVATCMNHLARHTHSDEVHNIQLLLR